MQIVFDEIDRDHEGPAKHGERHFSYLNRSSRIEAVRVRALVEEWNLVYRLSPRAVLGGAMAGHSYAWDKRQMRLEPLPGQFAEYRPQSSERRRELARRLGDQLLELLDMDHRSTR